MCDCDCWTCTDGSVCGGMGSIDVGGDGNDSEEDGDGDEGCGDGGSYGGCGGCGDCDGKGW